MRGRGTLCKDDSWVVMNGVFSVKRIEGGYKGMLSVRRRGFKGKGKK